MRVQLYEMDGVTEVTAFDVPEIDDLPKVVCWNRRAFLLVGANITVGEASYAEAVSLQIEMAEQ